VLNELARLLFTEALPMAQVVSRVRAFSRRRGDRAPSRASIYQWARVVPAPPVPVAELPPFARDALNNLAGTPLVPADQLAFCCFNYGDTRAIGYAAALPRPVLSRALSTPGWRPKSRALARAVLLSRRARFVEGRRLALTGLLGTKLHAILDRGTRRDFFDLYVLMQDQHVSITDAIAALRAMYGDLNEGLLFRALCFFDDADREARLPGEGPKDWAAVKRYFQEQVGLLVVPPLAELAIASRVVDVSAPKKRARAPARRKRPR
jgi:hypothetical protein